MKKNKFSPIESIIKIAKNGGIEPNIRTNSGVDNFFRLSKSPTFIGPVPR